MLVYVYLLKSLKDGSYYTGISSDPQARLIKHNQGGVEITSQKKPYDLVYTKVHISYQEARDHEKWLKKKGREYKNKLTQLAPPVKGGVK